MSTRRVGAAFQAPASGGAAAASAEGFPGLTLREPENRRRTIVTGSLAALVHGGLLGALILAASLAPVIEEELIPVQLLRDEPPAPDEPAPAPRALAERRPLPFSPQVQAVAPQIVNPRVVADAAPAVRAEALQMDAVGSVQAPQQINRSATVVERVSSVNSIATARASRIDVSNIGAAAVRGPTKIDAPVGPSVGPRQVKVATGARTIGTGTLAIGEGSSVREGVVSNRDVLGSPTGSPLVRVDVAVGDGLLRGSGGEGSSISGGAVSDTDCLNRPEVQAYMGVVRDRMFERWTLPPGVGADQTVKLKFRLDVAGSPSEVEMVRASSNALGASAVDALRAAAPFPPIPEPARCLARRRITGTFSNPGAG